jgi:hypothetical protein
VSGQFGGYLSLHPGSFFGAGAMPPEAAVRLCGYAPHRPRNGGALAAALTARFAGNMPYGLRQTTTGCRAIAPIWDRKRRNKAQLVSPLTRTKKRQTLPSRTTDRSAQMATSFSFSIRRANVWGRKEFWEPAESAAMLQPRIGIHRRPGRCGNKKRQTLPSRTQWPLRHSPHEWFWLVR